jgi:hypothetical protein
MTMLETFKANLKTAAIAQQADLFARADEIDASAKGLIVGRKLQALRAQAAALRDEACRIGDRYFELVAG